MAATSKKSAKAKTRKAAPVLDLREIENELNKDPDAQAAFIRNPTRFMEDRGLKLRGADKTALKNLKGELTTGPRLPAGTEGSALSAGITIVIRRRF